MLNRLSNLWTDDADHSHPWNPDRTPTLRLAMMWIGILLPMVAIILRMAQLQIVLQDDFVSGFEQTYEVFEDIPARQGRILAADGSVLAGEEERYDLQMNYRLIQQPADERWLRGEARRNLDRKERKDSQKVEAEEQRVLNRREELWAAVSKLTQRDAQELADTRIAIQQRIAQMKEDVIRKRGEREARKAADPPSTETAGTGLRAIWNRVRKELTEPPTRSLDSEPLVEEVSCHTIVAGVNSDVRAEIEAHPERYPGLQIAVQTRRVYPQGELGSHLVGSRTPLSADEVRQRRQADASSLDRIGDSIGRNGLERKYDAHLRGARGQRRLLKNRRGDVITSEVLREPRHGRDLVLTLDVDVQRRAEQLLDEALMTVTAADTVDDEATHLPTGQPTCPKGGCIVAVDVYSGAVLAAASAPRFDLNLLTHPDREQWNDLMADPRKPMFSRVTHMKVAPGSVFKVISAVASLESGTVNPDVPIPCRGYLDRPDQHRCAIYRNHKVGHGDMLLADALCRSCNVYFFAAARRMGPQPLVDWATRFGFGQRTGIDLPSEEAGHLPSPDEQVQGHRRRWYPGDTLGLAIGQADLEVTPLQMVRAMAAVANGGQLVTPHLAGETGPVSLGESPSFRPTFSHPEPQPIQGLHSETLAHIREGLEMVVNHPGGTAYKTAKLKDVRMAGKTGTAETGGVDHAWFAGYVPSEQPRVAFVVVLEHGGSGGKSAGPVARQFVSRLLELGLVTPTTNLARE